MIKRPETTRLWAFDPGLTTGWAYFENGKLVDIGQAKKLDFFNVMKGIRLADYFIVEEFRIRPDKKDAFVWSDMETVQVIGALRFRAFDVGAKFETQSPTIKSIGYRWGAISQAKDHSMSHQLDAVAHGVYYNTHVLKFQPPASEKMKAKLPSKELDSV